MLIQGESNMKNSHKMAVLLTFSVRVLNTTRRMDQASMRELLTFVEKNRIVKLSMCKVDSVFQKILLEEKIYCLLTLFDMGFF